MCCWQSSAASPERRSVLERGPGWSRADSELGSSDEVATVSVDLSLRLGNTTPSSSTSCVADAIELEAREVSPAHSERTA